MNYLSLFSGGAGGDLGMQHLLGFNCVGYVEYEEYCQKILLQRQRDGFLSPGPIFGDIRKFISEGYAESYKGMVDLITAGFPCQPFSVAGKRLAEDDPRNMWPATKDCLSVIRPEFAFLENVPGLLADRYIKRIFGDLSEMGYNAKWGIIGADDAGAPHRRKRLWIYASDTMRTGRWIQQELPDWQGAANFDNDGEEKPLAYADSEWKLQPKRCEQKQWGWVGNGCEKVPNTSSIYAQGFKDESREVQLRRGSWWGVEPGLGRVANGVANRVDRLKAIGNGQVPQCVALAWETLTPSDLLAKNGINQGG